MMRRLVGLVDARMGTCCWIVKRLLVGLVGFLTGDPGFEMLAGSMPVEALDLFEGE